MFHDDEATGRNKNPSHFTNTTGIMVCRAAHALVMWYALRMLDINNNNNNIFRVQWKPKSCSSNMLKWLVSTTSALVHSPLLSDPNRTIVQKKYNRKCETFWWYFPSLFSILGCLKTTRTLSALCNSFYFFLLLVLFTWLFLWDFRLSSSWSWFRFLFFYFSFWEYYFHELRARCDRISVEHAVPAAKYSFAAEKNGFFDFSPKWEDRRDVALVIAHFTYSTIIIMDHEFDMAMWSTLSQTADSIALRCQIFFPLLLLFFRLFVTFFLLFDLLSEYLLFTTPRCYRLHTLFAHYRNHFVDLLLWNTMQNFVVKCNMNFAPCGMACSTREAPNEDGVATEKH